jgi:pimeloyl-ACP methyl ester carboxylesterase
MRTVSVDPPRAALAAAFTPAHRGGSGPPLVLLHGFIDTWRTWELALPALETHHDVLAPTLAGHAGGPAIEEHEATLALIGAVERAMDAAGFATAHLAGNSLGGYVALRLAMRGRARSVVAFAPAGGWAPHDHEFRDEHVPYFARMQRQLKLVAPHAEAALESPAGRRRATQAIAQNFEHIPRELLAHQLRGVVGCWGLSTLTERAVHEGWRVDAQSIACPVRIVWGTEDRLLPWPSAAVRYREEWLAHADWVELEGVGHCPQLDVPLQAAQLILGVTAP